VFALLYHDLKASWEMGRLGGEVTGEGMEGLIIPVWGLGGLGKMREP